MYELPRLAEGYITLSFNLKVEVDACPGKILLYLISSKFYER
jgi:hypothetical protein